MPRCCALPCCAAPLPTCAPACLPACLPSASFLALPRPPAVPLPQVYCLDSQFTSEMPKFIAGTLQVRWRDWAAHRVPGAKCSQRGQCKVSGQACLLPRLPVHTVILAADTVLSPAPPATPQALSAMVQLELPHVNVLTKADLCKDKQGLEGFRFPDPMEMRHELDKQVRRVAVSGWRGRAGGGVKAETAAGRVCMVLVFCIQPPQCRAHPRPAIRRCLPPNAVCPPPCLQTGPHFRRLNDAVVQLLDDFAMVTFTVGASLNALGIAVASAELLRRLCAQLGFLFLASLRLLATHVHLSAPDRPPAAAGHQ